MSALRDGARRFLEWRHATWLVLLAALVVALPSIQLGFYNDDHALRAAVDGTWPEGPPFWDLYRFASGGAEENRLAVESGSLPWWSAPGLKLHLVRPLTSVLFTFEHRLLGDAPLGYHLHSIAWYLALVATVGFVLRGALPRATAQLATLVYALSAAHFFPYAWVSCRHMLLSALPALLGFASFVRDPSPERRRGRWLLALGLAIGLGAGEGALGAAGFPIAYVLCRKDPAERRSLVARVRARLPSIAPTLALLAAYIVIYARVGGGAAQSGGYVDPLGNPGRFAAKAATMLPVLLANAFAGVPAEAVTIAPPAPIMITGVIVTALIAWLARSLAPSMSAEERAAIPWLVLGAVFALVPSLGGFPGARVLLVPDLGFSALLAILIRRGFAAGGLARGAFAALLALVHLVGGPLVSLGVGAVNTRAARDLERIAAAAETGAARPRVFVLGVSDPTVTMYVPAVLAANAPDRIACWSVLSGAKQAHRITRTSAAELHLRPARGTMLQGLFETLYRASDLPVRVGEEARQCGATFRVVAVDDGRPTEVAIQFDAPLDDPRIRLLQWREGNLRALAPPPVGESLDVAWEAGPLGSF
ncbi:MAG: hypothetical protein KF819_28440 [Labilithrix sp.]|nr:hypothetical protein [Labilithrix sp.]